MWLCDQVYALDASTGSRVWAFNTESTVVSSPAVADGRVFVGSNEKVRVAPPSVRRAQGRDRVAAACAGDWRRFLRHANKIESSAVWPHACGCWWLQVVVTGMRRGWGNEKRLGCGCAIRCGRWTHRPGMKSGISGNGLKACGAEVPQRQRWRTGGCLSHAVTTRCVSSSPRDRLQV